MSALHSRWAATIRPLSTFPGWLTTHCPQKRKDTDRANCHIRLAQSVVPATSFDLRHADDPAKPTQPGPYRQCHMVRVRKSHAAALLKPCIRPGRVDL